MSVGSSAEILVLSNIQAKALAGSLLAIGEDLFRLKDYNPAYPGQPPWRSGAEGKAYPLLARDGTVAAYLKFFTRPTQSRLNRTAWLIGQQMHTWLPGLSAAPLLWVDTRLSPRSAEIDFDFAGYLAQAVPGETWLELKHHIVETGVSLPADVRWRCVEDLVLATAVLERADIVHGDLSPNNIVIDPAAPAGDPALCLIDFDAFVAPAAGPDRAVNLAAGGTYGTEGYCPPDLGARAAAGDGSAAPYSDRYGRDVLILELLLMDPGFSPDDPPAIWDRQRLGRAYAQWRASCGKGDIPVCPNGPRKRGLSPFSPGPPGPARGVFAIRGPAPQFDAAGGRPGAGVAGGPGDLHRSAGSSFPFGYSRHSFGLGAGPTAASAPTRAPAPRKAARRRLPRLSL